MDIKALVFSRTVMVVLALTIAVIGIGSVLAYWKAAPATIIATTTPPDPENEKERKKKDEERKKKEEERKKKEEEKARAERERKEKEARVAKSFKDELDRARQMVRDQLEKLRHKPKPPVRHAKLPPPSPTLPPAVPRPGAPAPAPGDPKGSGGAPAPSPVLLRGSGKHKYPIQFESDRAFQQSITGTRVWTYTCPDNTGPMLLVTPFLGTDTDNVAIENASCARSIRAQMGLRKLYPTKGMVKALQVDASGGYKWYIKLDAGLAAQIEELRAGSKRSSRSLVVIHGDGSVSLAPRKGKKVARR